MPFMEKQVEYGKWWVVDGPMGGEVVPFDLIGDQLSIENIEEDGRVIHRIVEPHRSYFENTWLYDFEVISGWCGRLSAPGYMDRTEWDGPYETKKDAMEALSDAFDQDEDNEEEE
jgi:hypothetical protein